MVTGLIPHGYRINSAWLQDYFRVVTESKQAQLKGLNLDIHLEWLGLWFGDGLKQNNTKRGTITIRYHQVFSRLASTLGTVVV